MPVLVRRHVDWPRQRRFNIKINFPVLYRESSDIGCCHTITKTRTLGQFFIGHALEQQISLFMVAALEGYAFLKAAGKAEGVDALKQLLGKRFDGQGVRAPAPAAAV